MTRAVFGGAIVALLIAVACSEDERCPVDGEGLVSVLQRVVEGGGEVVNLKEIATFAWDRMYVFNEYSAATDVNEATGLEYATGSYQNHVPEGHDLVVFVLEGAPVCHFEILDGRSTSVAWTFYGSAYSDEGVAASEAVFRVDRSAGVARLIPMAAGSPE